MGLRKDVLFRVAALAACMEIDRNVGQRQQMKKSNECMGLVVGVGVLVVGVDCDILGAADASRTVKSFSTVKLRYATPLRSFVRTRSNARQKAESAGQFHLYPTRQSSAVLITSLESITVDYPDSYDLYSYALPLAPPSTPLFSHINFVNLTGGHQDV